LKEQQLTLGHALAHLKCEQSNGKSGENRPDFSHFGEQNQEYLQYLYNKVNSSNGEVKFQKHRSTLKMI